MQPPMWAPWRLEYILGPKAQGCIFCAYAGHSPGEFQADLTLYASDLAYVTLNRYPFAAGHLLVIPRRHCAAPGDLTPEEHDALFRLTTQAGERLRRAVKADGLNVGMNLGASAGAGIAEHLHVHIVPRWPGDTNFMPVLADVRVMPQALEATWRHLLPFFADLPGEHPTLVMDDKNAPPRLLHLLLFHASWIALLLGLLLAARDVLLPFVLALIVAYVFTPLVARLERARIPRWVAILLTYAVSLGSMYASIHLMAPTLAREFILLRGEAPALIERVKSDWTPRLEARLRDLGMATEPPAPDEWDKLPSAVRLVPAPNGAYDLYVARGFEVRSVGEHAYHVDQAEPPNNPSQSRSLATRVLARAIEYGRSNTLELLRFGQVVVAAVSRGIFVFFLTLMLAAYLMLTRERVYAFFRRLCLPPHRPSFDQLMERVDHGLSGVVRGQLLICLVNGVLTAIGFWLLGLKYWPIFSLIAGVMSIIPIFGAILSSVPAVLIGLTQSFGTALAVLAWIVAIHQLEANFLNPKIIGDAAKIHPVLVVFSLVVGEHLFKLPGALLAVPVLSITQSFFLHFQKVVYGDETAAE